MDAGVCVKIWGTRGSFPAPFPDRMKYGGNTVCMSVRWQDRILAMDAGSGLASLGEQIDKKKEIRRVDLFLSHLHLDHVMGLVHFPPFFNPEMEIHIYGEGKEGQSLQQRLDLLVGPPWWPVGFEDFKARLVWHEVMAGMTWEEPGGPAGPAMTVSTMGANHPGGGLLYRFQVNGRGLLYGLDCEMDGSVWEELVSFSKGCGLLVCDGPFTQEELADKGGWGHSSWQQAVKLRREAGAGRVLVTHHEWSCTDEILDARGQEARREDPYCILAKEGMEVIV